MSSLAQRKYVFRRRPIWGRLALGVLALGGTIWALTMQNADAMPGGYRPDIAIEVLGSAA